MSGTGTKQNEVKVRRRDARTYIFVARAHKRPSESHTRKISDRDDCAARQSRSRVVPNQRFVLDSEGGGEWHTYSFLATQIRS